MKALRPYTRLRTPSHLRHMQSRRARHQPINVGAGRPRSVRVHWSTELAGHAQKRCVWLWDAQSRAAVLDIPSHSGFIMGSGPQLMLNGERKSGLMWIALLRRVASAQISQYRGDEFCSGAQHAAATGLGARVRPCGWAATVRGEECSWWRHDGRLCSKT